MNYEKEKIERETTNTDMTEAAAVPDAVRDGAGSTIAPDIEANAGQDAPRTSVGDAEAAAIPGTTGATMLDARANREWNEAALADTDTDVAHVQADAATGFAQSDGEEGEIQDFGADASDEDEEAGQASRTRSKKKKQSPLQKFWYWAKEIILAILIASVILFFVKPIAVRQSSMEPNFHSGDYLFVSRQSYTLFGKMERGDVIVFHSRLRDEDNHDKNLIKRIIALPGDEIALQDGYVYINGTAIQEDYLGEQGQTWAKTPDGNMDPVVVPEGSLFVMGDNRTNSEDSRSAEVGFIDIDEVLGKVVIRLYPFNSIRIF